MKRSTSLFLPLVCAAIILSLAVGAQAQTFSVLYSFAGGSDGYYETGGVVRDSAGNLYGTTADGGDASCVSPYGCGTVFKVDPSGNKSVLYSFTGGTDGGSPSASLILDAAGNLYGTTYYGGYLGCGVPSACGTVFKLSPSGDLTTLYRFKGAPDGANPESTLVRDAKGNLYGTTVGGGNSTCFFDYGCGTVFKINAAGKETVLYRFNGSDGEAPYAGVVRDPAGNLFGTTLAGGDSTCYCGTVFKLDPTGKETVLHAFTDVPDGATPQAGLVADAKGNLYGVTNSGGQYQYSGAVFRVTPSGKESILYSFNGPAGDGSFPSATLVRDQAGNLYGTTFFGGANNLGTVFMLDTTGKKTVLHTFGSTLDGYTPNGVIRDSAGNLYGATNNGFAPVFGTVFKLVP
jgi:uncharacterized repeat protein (TIGR03803 family)